MPREGYLTASSIAAAAGLNPYQSRQECARLLLGLKDQEPFEGADWGNEQEPLTLRAYEVLTGNLVEDQQAWFEQGYLGCHVDGLVRDEHGLVVVEAKSPVSLESFEKNYQVPPLYYIPQVQVQMALAGASACHFVARFDDQTRIWLIEPNVEYYQALRAELDWFWDNIRAMRVPPRRAKPKMPTVIPYEIVF